MSHPKSRPARTNTATLWLLNRNKQTQFAAEKAKKGKTPPQSSIVTRHSSIENAFTALRQIEAKKTKKSVQFREIRG